MKKFIKITFVLLCLVLITNLVSADRGIGKKKNNIVINIVTNSSLKKSIPFNLKSGLTYRGSTLFSHEQIGSSLYNNTLVTYKKGNTIYILPYKQRIITSDYSNGSYKLVIRHK